MKFTKNELYFIAALIVFTVVVHFLNLGLFPLFGDEGIRGTVSFEMMKHENYIVPSKFGWYYYRKPPLYNWIMIGFFYLTNSYSEFVLRLPSVIPLFLFGATIWYVAKSKIGSKPALLAAFLFILSGRLLTRDSMLGHIDIFYSWVTFIEFYLIWYFWKRKAYWKLFLFSYLLAAAGVLMKGLPSFIFQGATLFVWSIYLKDFKRLFSVQHIVSFLLFAGIIVGYFYAYAQYNSLETYFNELYFQSSQRTVVEHAWWENVLQLITFPIENFGHLFPSSLLLLFLFKKDTVRNWLKDDFMAFTFLVLAINSIPYWLSPGYYPRYLFMLYPLLFILGADAYFKRKDKWAKLNNWILGFFLVFGVAVALAPLYTFSVDYFTEKPFHIWGVLLMLVIGVGCAFFWFKPKYKLWASLAFVALFRLGFDLYILPYRVDVEQSQYVFRKETSKKLVELTQDAPLYLYKNTPMFEEFGYYIGTEKDQIIQIKGNYKSGNYYLTTDSMLPENQSYDRIYSFELGYEDFVIRLIKVH